MTRTPSQREKRFHSVSGRFLFAVIYASGEKGKAIRADGKGGKLARGFYFSLCPPNARLSGTYRTQREAAQAARDYLAALAPHEYESL